MKRICVFLLLTFISCDYDGDKFRDIDVYPDSGTNGNEYEYTYGEEFHCVFTTSEPVLLTDIYYYTTSNEGEKREDQKYISRTYYEHPPFEVDWEGVRVEVRDFQTIEIWIDADARPTTEESSGFCFDLNPIRFWYDESTIWYVDDIVIIRTQPAEEVPTE